MIHLFEKRGIIFPARWANSVSKWIAGVCSRTGTIRITNTMDPDGNGSASFDVDIEVLVKKIQERLNLDYVRKDSLKEIVDATSIDVSGGMIAVKTEYVLRVSKAQG